MKRTRKFGINTLRIVGLIALCIAANTALKFIQAKTESLVGTIKTKKSPSLIAAEQLAFIECKKKDGAYKEKHGKDLNFVLKRYGIDRSILDSDAVKSASRKMIEGGACEFMRSYDSLEDAVTMMREGRANGPSSFKKLKGWQFQVVDAIAEAECKTSLGQLDGDGRNIYLEKRLGKINTPPELTEKDFVSFIQKSMPTVLWLAEERSKNKLCDYMPVLPATHQGI